VRLARRLRTTLKSWITIEDHENEQITDDSFGRNSPRRIYEAARLVAKCAGTGIERAAAPHQSFSKSAALRHPRQHTSNLEFHLSAAAMRTSNRAV
jgi:hypothetical protein